MASDEEIERHVRQHEQRVAGPDEDESLEDHRERAAEIHDELARRISDVDDAAASADDIAQVVEKLEALEDRIEALEHDE